jgi:ubiquinone/menaquinone biosynthesis C-methylase UbiE
VQLSGIDLTPEMLAIAHQRSTDLAVPVTLSEADAQALPFRDEAFDTVVCTYAMCSVPDERAALLEMWRVLKPGGRLILVDHIRSSVKPLYWLQRLMERMPSRNRNDLTRRPRDHLEATGFTIEASERFRAGVVERLVARKP